METFLTEFLFSNKEHIFLRIKDELGNNNLIETYEKVERNLIINDQEVNFILEIIFNGLMNAILSEGELKDKKIKLSHMFLLIRKFRAKTKEFIKIKFEDRDMQDQYIDALDDMLEKLQTLMIEKYEVNDKLYLNFESVAQVGNSIVIVTKDDVIHYANEIAQSVMGIKDEEIGEIHIKTVFDQVSQLNTVKNDRIDIIYEGKTRRANGKEKWIEFRINNNILKEVGMKLIYGHDISDRKAMEIKLKESEEKYRVLLEVMPDPLYVYNEKGITYANNAAINMFGYNRLKDIKNKNVNSLMRVAPEYESNYQQKMDKLKRTGRMNALETKCFRRKDNNPLEIETTSVAYQIGQDNFVVNISRDILEKNRIRILKEGVREKTLKLVEARKYDELKNEFLANISHEFKTPINIIMTSMKLIDTLSDRDSLSKEDLERYTFLSKQNCYRLIKLVENILDLTKIDAGHMELNLQKSNIVEFTEKVADSVREFLESKELELIFDTDQEESEVLFDMAVLERIILNLLANSAKYTNPGGTIQVNVENKEDVVLIHVEDNGIGIPDDKQKVIFDRFVQVDKTLTRNKEGSGIGLALVKELVDVHQGKIKLTSDEGKGSKFTIEIPQNKVEFERLYNDSKHISKKTRTLIESIDIQFSDIYSQW